MTLPVHFRRGKVAMHLVVRWNVESAGKQALERRARDYPDPVGSTFSDCCHRFFVNPDARCVGRLHGRAMTVTGVTAP
jgi:hypothetical protein